MRLCPKRSFPLKQRMCICMLKIAWSGEGTGNVRTGKDPKRRKVHSSMYANLRTNLPREVMAYTDFPFDDLQGKSKDDRRFPSHAEVRPFSHMTWRQMYAYAVNHS